MNKSVAAAVFAAIGLGVSLLVISPPTNANFSDTVYIPMDITVTVPEGPAGPPDPHPSATTHAAPEQDPEDGKAPSPSVPAQPTDEPSNEPVPSPEPEEEIPVATTTTPDPASDEESDAGDTVTVPTSEGQPDDSTEK